jgi:hypothetical protein
MKCHSCHNEPATVGLLCRTCVDKNRSKASQREEDTIKQIRAASANDSLMHRAAMSWEFKVAVIAGFFAVCFVIIATTGQSAHADFVTKLLLTSFITSTMVTMASYLWLWLSMYGSEGAGQLLYLISPRRCMAMGLAAFGGDLVNALDSRGFVDHRHKCLLLSCGSPQHLVPRST